MEANNILLSFSDYDESVLRSKIIDIKTIEESKAIHSRWQKISEIYHTTEEEKFILEILKNMEDKYILDPSFGSGFPLHLLKKHNFSNLYASDIPSNNLLESICEDEKIRCFHSSFKDLARDTIRKDYDIIFVIGASLSYCQSWELNKKSHLDIQEIYNSIKGLKNVLDKGGVLYIGNAKVYHSGNTIDNIPFYDADKNIRMRWILTYDWINNKKLWNCKFYDKHAKEKFDIELESHLFTNDMLINYCMKYFDDVQLITSPKNCPEDIIKCSKPKK